MFGKSKVTQSMIDAVKQVVETAPIKEPTPTGMRVYGGSYGNSAKAKQDQTKSAVDTIKGPKDKEMKEAAKPDFLDFDKDGNTKESMKKALADKAKGMKEELKGNQDKIDANHNGKIDGQDFAILRGKKKVKEGREFAEKLLATINEKKDVVMPEDSTPAKNTDIADKSYLKDMGKKPTVKSDLKNLGRFLTGKKETNEEVELKEGVEVKKEYDDKHETEHGVYHNGKKIGYVVHSKKHDTHTAYHNPTSHDEHGHADDYGQIDDFHKHHHAISQIKASAGVNEEVKQVQERDEGKPGLMFKKIAAKATKEYGSKEAGNRVAGAIRAKILAKEEVTEEELDEELNEVLSKNASAGDWIHDFIHSDNPKFAGKSKAERKKMALGAYYGKQNEETYKNPDESPITTDTLAGRMPGGKFNSFKSYKLGVKPSDKEGDGSVKEVDGEKVNSTAARKSIHTEESVEEATIAGTPGWEKIKNADEKGNVKDKSGATHTPMSRAKDLARQAFKKIKNETMMGKISN
jgi:hypothetical protein